MEDENGLELSLGLPCGGAAASQKAKISSSSDTRSEEVDRDSKLINDFKNFLEGGNQKHDNGIGSSRIDPKTKGNFFNDLSSAAVDVDTSKNLNSSGFWVNDRRSSEVEEKRLDVGDKRKNFFGEASQHKKHEREPHHGDLHDKTRASHISITTDDGSTAENEDVADSEAEGSTSRQVSQLGDSSKRYIGATALADMAKEIHAVDSGNVDLAGQRRFTISSEKEFKLGNMPYAVPFPGQPVNITNIPYSFSVKDANPSSAPPASSYPLPGMVQVVSATNSERPGSQPVIPANLPIMFGYSPVQLPTLDKDNSRVLVSHHQQLHPSYTGRGLVNSDKRNDGLNITQVAPHWSSESMHYDSRAVERIKGNGKQHAAEEGSSLLPEDDAKGSNTNFRPKETCEQPRIEGFPSEFPTIRPGLAADLKFGGCGSYPNLPWVSTTAPGPNGRTISGVTYRFSPTQIRIVCACHGSHMSPEEFVRHATEEANNSDVGTGVTSIPNSNPAASAQS